MWSQETFPLPPSCLPGSSGCCNGQAQEEASGLESSDAAEVHDSDDRQCSHSCSSSNDQEEHGNHEEHDSNEEHHSNEEHDNRSRAEHESPGGRRSSQGQEGAFEDQGSASWGDDEGTDGASCDDGVEGEEEQEKVGRGKYDRSKSSKRLSFSLQKRVGLHEDNIKEAMVFDCGCKNKCTDRVSKDDIVKCRENRYSYTSHQRSNSTYLYPKVKEAWGKNDNGEWRWSFKIGHHVNCCASAFYVAYDCKETTFKQQRAAAKDNNAEWKACSMTERVTGTSNKAIWEEVGFNPSAVKQSLAWAWMAVWFDECCDADHNPKAGEKRQLDPIEHKEIYNEYKAEMASRRQPSYKQFPSFNTELNNFMKKNSYQIREKKDVTSDCAECIYVRQRLKEETRYNERAILKQRRRDHRVFNATAQAQVQLNNEKAERSPCQINTCTIDIMDQAKLECPQFPSVVMSKSSEYAIKTKLTAICNFNQEGPHTMFYQALPQVKKGGNLTLTEWLHSVSSSPQPIAPVQIWQVDGGTENWSKAIWLFQAWFVETRRVAEFQNLRKTPSHTHGLCDQRFSRISTVASKCVLCCLSAILKLCASAFETITVKTCEAPAAIDFGKLYEKCYSPELLRGGYGSHPKPVDGGDWTKPTDPNPNTIHCTRVYLDEVGAYLRD